MGFQPEVNQQAVRTYAIRLSNRFLDNFFVYKTHASGAELIEFTPVKQINLLVMSSLQYKWKQETERLKSPFFDFENLEVREGLRNFMNVLSQHIKVERQHLEPLLVEAIQDTLMLSISPLDFFKKELEAMGNPKVSVKRLKESLKYILINKALPEAVIAEMDSLRNTEMYAGEMLRYFNKAMHEGVEGLFNSELLIAELNRIYPLKLTELIPNAPVKPEPAIPKPTEREGYAPSFFSQFHPDGTDETREVEPVAETVNNEIKKAETKSPALPKEEKKPITKDTVKAEPIISKTVNVNPEPANINSSLKANSEGHEALNVLAAKSKIASLNAAIALNDRFLYIRELFNGDKLNWEQALSQLETETDKNKVVNEILPYWATRFKWQNTPGSVAEQFTEVVLRRFVD